MKSNFATKGVFHQANLKQVSRIEKPSTINIRFPLLTSDANQSKRLELSELTALQVALVDSGNVTADKRLHLVEDGTLSCGELIHLLTIEVTAKAAHEAAVKRRNAH